MTTLIDRIMKSIISLDTSSDQDDKIRQILEAELTVVKGVDELINDYTLWMEAEQNILKNADHSARNFIQKTKGRIEVISQILEDLKYTPVASQPNKIIREWRIIDGKQVILEREIDQPTEERLKDYQPKEVEKEEYKTRTPTLQQIVNEIMIDIETGTANLGKISNGYWIISKGNIEISIKKILGKYKIRI